jgi:hypothetical protein
LGGYNFEFSKNKKFGERQGHFLQKRDDAKHDNPGLTCTFVGYSESHSKDTYRMWDPKTRKVSVTRDIRCLNRRFFTIKDQESFEFTKLPAFDNSNGNFNGYEYYLMNN